MYTISTRAGLPTGSNPNGEVNSASFLKPETVSEIRELNKDL